MMKGLLEHFLGIQTIAYNSMERYSSKNDERSTCQYVTELAVVSTHMILSKIPGQTSRN